MAEIGKAHIQVVPVFDGFAQLLRDVADTIEGRPCSECSRRERADKVRLLHERTEHYNGESTDV